MNRIVWYDLGRLSVRSDAFTITGYNSRIQISYWSWQERIEISIIQYKEENEDYMELKKVGWRVFEE